MPTLLNEYKVKKSRKTHKCHGCLKPIEIGMPCLANVNVDGGEIYTLYFCKSCEDFMKEYCVNCGDCFDDGLYKGDIAECMRCK